MGSDNSVKYTLCYEKLAKEGYRFIYLGSTSQCEACRLQGVCLTNLESGRLYEVVSVRDVAHPCAVHDRVVTVTVHEPTHEVAVRSRVAIPGSTLTWSDSECDQVLCENYNSLCKPEYLHPGDRLHIKGKNGVLTCPKGAELTKIEATRFA